MGEPTTHAGDSVAASFASLVEAYDQARAAVVALPDGRMVFDRGTELAALLLRLRGDAADLRGIGAARIQRSEALTMQEVADRIGVTRQRAQQFVRVGRATDPDHGDDAESREPGADRESMMTRAGRKKIEPD